MNTAPSTQALELVLKNNPEVPVAFACPRCGLLYMVPLDASAEQRASTMADANRHCIKDCVCGKPLESHYRLRCADCRARLKEAKRAALYEAATKLSLEDYPAGALYWEGHVGDIGDGYFSSMDALLDVCENEGWDVPKYVWACTRHEFQLRADTWLSAEIERQQLYEGAYSDIDSQARTRLQAYLDVWARELGLHGWTFDHSRAIVLCPEDVEALELGQRTH